jgi:general nucleoside transport system permease protein
MNAATDKATPVGAAPAHVPGGASAETVQRPWRSLAEGVVIPVCALLLAMAAFGIFCAFAGANPFGVFASIRKAAFGSWYSFQNTLVHAAPIMLCALCTAIPMRLGMVVIGNEGALVVGGLGAVIVGTHWTSLSPTLALAAMALAGMVCGGFWIMACGALKLYRGVNEVISSLLMNYIAIAILNHLVNGPIRDPASLNKPSSYPIPDDNMLGTIPGTFVHWGLAYGVVACLLVWFLMEHTTYGFQVNVVGGNIRAARIVGLPVGALTLSACWLAGACAGLAGMVEVAAVQGRANESLAAGYGYAGILVAFVGRHHGLGVLLVSILLGGILASGGILQRERHLSDAAVLVFQGIVFVAILFSDSLYGKFRIFQERARA